MSKSFLVLATAICSATCATTTTGSEPPHHSHWTQWRGPFRDSKIKATVWPSELDEGHLLETWSMPLQPGYSGPIVESDRVFVTETKNESAEVVRAFDRSTGKQLWETQWEGAMQVPFFAAANGSWIRATPACDGTRLYVAGMRDLLVCLETKTGQILWQVDFPKSTGSALPSFGFVSSPLVTDNHVYVQAGGGLTKLDKLTGEILWQSLKDGGGMGGSAFSSPVVAKICDVEQLVVQTREKLVGVEPKTGAVLWSKSVEAFRGMNILTPTVIGDTIFTSSYGGGSMLIEVACDTDDWSVTEVWKNRAQGYMSSPVVVGEHIYLHLRNQRFTCLDVKTGETRWTTTPFGKYWSIVANGDKLLALDERGELLLIQASPEEFRLIDRRQVAENSWAHLAVAGQQVFVRDLEALKVFRFEGRLDR